MRIAIVYKKDKVRDRSVVPSLISAFESRGHSVSVFYSGNDLKDVDQVLVLGGDGALLHTAIIAANLKIPVMGINFGKIGFLCELEANESAKAVDVMLGKHKILSRTMLKITFNQKVSYALNECLLQRDYSKSYGNQVAEIGVRYDGHKIMDAVSDGIAIATPTGSTAYSLSAGGSVMHPMAKAWTVTPICPFNLSLRPVILPDDGKITFSLDRQKDPLKLYADGKLIGTVTKESEITVERAPNTANFITRDAERMFNVIDKKLR